MENTDEITCRRETYLSAIANNEGSGNLPDPICREEIYLKQIAENGIGGGSGGTTNYTALSNKPSINGVTLTGNLTSADLGITSGGSSSIPVVEASGTSITLQPNTHTVITGVTNSLKISVAEAETTELKHYSFEFTSIDRKPSVTFTNITGPYSYEYDKYKGYVGEVINNKVCYKTIYDAYPFQFIYGTYAKDDWTSSYYFKNDLTVSYVNDSTTKEGRYSISLDGDTYSIYIEYEDNSDEFITMTNQGTFTVNGVVYTKS